LSSSKHIIEINNKKYDAKTGMLISQRPVTAPAQPKTKVINDISPSNHPQPRIIKPVQKAVSKPKPAKTQSNAKAGNLNTPQKSLTLMRPSVKKPALHPKPSEEKQKNHQVSLGAASKNRLHRASSVAKSSKISKFHHSDTSRQIVPKLEKLEVKKQPPPKAKPTPAAQHNDWPVVDRFEQAVKEASSHLEEFVDDAKHSKKGRKLAYATASLVILAIVGFGAYTAIPMAKVKLAGNKAGFSPSLPSYSPAGFGMSGQVGANSGEVTLSYQSRTDDKGFKITQTPSEWNSQSLLNNFLSVSDKQYRTFESNGKTIYIYEDNNATWVDGGIWFKLEGNAPLTSDQIVKIADGL